MYLYQECPLLLIKVIIYVNNVNGELAVLKGTQ